ncbi:methyl-accepting chemotaxis protein [Pseudomonas arcuscaelestis]|uniref:methyl-accepting chemotaxis protein n=1 Tax=Pseudomonas arcuscaelestis TaxID=2710591 RepID=UPI001F2CF249|nr:methyl-accepting chemotaxis protein [Pseudomonas arcuscaelestis]
MSNNFSFVPLTAVLLIASGSAACITGYSFLNDNKADAFYTAQTYDLKAATLQSIYLADKAASDGAFAGQLADAEGQVERALMQLRNGDPVKGIPRAPEAVLRSLESLSASWDGIAPALAELIRGQAATEAFSRTAKEAKSSILKVIESGRAAESLLTGLNATATQREQLSSALSALDADVAGVTAPTVIDLVSLQGAETGVSKYLGALTAFGNSLPRDKAMMDELIKSYRAAQAAQGKINEATSLSTNTTQNLSHAKEIWQARDKIASATDALIATVKALPDARAINPTMVAVLGALTIALAILSVLLISRASASRAQAVESRGSTIEGSQRERSKELSVLLTEIERVGRGELDLTLSDDRDSTKEIAKLLNQVFARFHEIFTETSQTVMGLAAATEQTITTARNVDRNRDEQFRAIEHISSLIADMSNFIGMIQQLMGDTQRVANTVAGKVHAGSDSVNGVHEGILVQTQHLNSIQHRNKHLIESFQMLERISQFVKDVATKSELVAYNAYLVSDQIEGNSELSRAMAKSGEAVHDLSTQSKQVVLEIGQLLKDMNEAARDTQTAVDISLNEMQGLLTRSNNALASLKDIQSITESLTTSVDDVNQRTNSLITKSSEVSETMSSIRHYASENSAASEQTASAMNNLNRQAQNLHSGIQDFYSKRA